jgi:lysophospholipase L1-like esterase
MNPLRVFAFAVTLVCALPWTGRSDSSTNLPARWEPEIRAFEAADLTNPPPRGAILFIGSSSIRLWKSLAEDFKPLAVINRGFGGSELSDSVFFAGRIVIPYRPKQIVLYSGDNDLAAGKSPQQLLTDFQAFVRGARSALPDTRISYISVKPSPSRRHLMDRMREANRLISDWARTQDRLDFIDVFTPMLGPDGEPRPEIFAPDKLHLNAAGYQLWTRIVRPYLQR